MDMLAFLSNNPAMAFLALAGFSLVSLSVLLIRNPAPVRIPVRRESKIRR